MTEVGKPPGAESARAETRHLPRSLGASRTFALTSMQKALLAESMVAPDKGVNLLQVVWELDRAPDAERFRGAWQDAVDAFDALRLGFEWPEGAEEPRQAVLSSVPLRLSRLKSPARRAADHEAWLQRFLVEDRSAGFDLASPPPMRVALLQLGRGRAVCVMTIHHALVDGGSYVPLLQRVLDRYLHPSDPARAPDALYPQFSDFLEWLEGHDQEPGTRYFVRLLEGFHEPTPLPLLAGSARTAHNRLSVASQRLDPDAAAKLVAVARQAGATPNTLVQLAWGLLLSCHSGEDDVVFGATWAGRVETNEHASRVVGPLINTLPVRVRLGEAETVRGLIEALRRQHRATRPFHHTPLGEIKAASALAGSAQLFHTLVVFEKEKFDALLLGQDARWRGHRLWMHSQTTLPLVLAAYFRDGALVLDLEYDVGLYSAAEALGLLADYRRLLCALGDSLDESPYRVPMLEPSVRARLTVEEAAREILPAARPVVERLRERFALAPEAIAVREIGGRAITYSELARRVRRLSGALRERGVGPGVSVGVLLPRSIEAVVSLLAVLEAGGAFVPLDTAAPGPRLEFMLSDSGAKLVLVGRATRCRLDAARGLELDVEDLALAQAPESSREPLRLDPASPAYVIYTSGSTGEPKGVSIPHAALANHVSATLELFELGPQDRVLQFAASTFDVSLEEILPTLAAGGRLVLRDDAVATSARGFFDAVRDEGLTVVNLPTAFWHLLVRDEGASWPAHLRLVIVGGETVSPEALRRFRAADTGHVRWLNGYGPTEATITSTVYDDRQADHDPEFVPIGRPLPGVSHFVLDRHRRLVPEGELHIGGAGLALGYLNREPLTRERFVEHPFRPGARLYATGDRVRRTAAGNYVFLGRIDSQVKVRGYRVELGEIEACLRQHAAVTDAVVLLGERGGGERSLVGFVVADARAVAPAALREHLAAALPAYMIPPRLVIVSALPTTPSGKIDHRALAALDGGGSEEPAPSPAADDPLLSDLMRVWTRLLDKPVADTTASFFDLGGDSLLVVEMFSEIESSLGRTCDAPAFFRNPTLSNLATLLRTPAEAEWSAPLIRLASGQAGKRPLFLAPAVSGRGLDYVHLAEALGDGVPIYALQVRGLRGGDREHATLREAAADFTALMREVQPHGPYAVAGFSAGGVAALAIAEELRALGERTDFVGLIDSGPPKSVPVPSPFSSPTRALRLARTAVGRVWQVTHGGGLRQLWLRTRSALLRSLPRWKVLGYEPRFTDYLGEIKCSPEEAARMQRYFEAISGHEFQGLPIDVVLFRVALDPFEGPHEPMLGWTRVTGGKITVEYLPGDHGSVMTAAGCRQWVARLEAHLDRRA